jgi:hypothetical protein
MKAGLLSGCCLSGLFVLGAVCPVSAQTDDAGLTLEQVPSDPVWERGSIRLGAYFANFNSAIGFIIGPKDDARLNGEDVLGLPDTQTVFRGDALYRLGKRRRHQLDFSYAAYRRDGRATLTDPIDLGGGVVIPALQVDSVLNFDIIRLGYTYAIVQTDHVRIGAGVNAYVLPIEYGLEFVTGETPSSLEPRSLIVPVPALALRADFRVWRQLYVASELNGVYLNLLGFEGSLFDATISVEYRLWKHLAVGAGYNGTLVNVGTTEKGADYPGVSSLGEIDVKFHGAMIFARLTF